MKGFFKRISKSETTASNGHADLDDEFHDSAEAQLHPEAHDEGGYAFSDKELLARQRGVVTEVIREMGKKLLSGHLNLINVTLPVKMFEPRSYLEKLTDNWVYPHFLAEAAHTPDPVSRLELVITWFISGLQHSFQSWQKPFNPILGETFQADLSDGSTVAMEQISHHPPVSAFQLFGPDGIYEFSGLSQPDVSFELKANAVKTQAKGKRRIIFKDGTKIEIEYPTYHMRGLLYTAMPRGEVTGTATFLDTKNKLQGEVIFGKVAGQEHDPLLHRTDAFALSIHEVTLPSRDSDANEPALLEARKRSFGSLGSRTVGGITGGITSILHRGEALAPPAPVKGQQCASGQGNWLAFLDWNGVRQWTLSNEAAATWSKPNNLLPSDSRFRKDLLALQEGDLQKAQAAKEELEMKQRQDAKLRRPGVEAATSQFARSLSLGR